MIYGNSQKYYSNYNAFDYCPRSTSDNSQRGAAPGRRSVVKDGEIVVTAGFVYGLLGHRNADLQEVPPCAAV